MFSESRSSVSQLGRVVDVDETHLPSSLEQPRLTARHAWALVFIGTIADIVTTAAGIHLGAYEANPVGHAALATAGSAGMGAFKISSIAIAAAGWRLTPTWIRHLIPGLLGGIWIAIASWNAVIVGVLLL